MLAVKDPGSVHVKQPREYSKRIRNFSSRGQTHVLKERPSEVFAFRLVGRPAGRHRRRNTEKQCENQNAIRIVSDRLKPAAEVAQTRFRKPWLTGR